MIFPINTQGDTSVNMRSTNTPRLLVSVKNLPEAEAAVAGGADWIDLKQPSQGPLGPVDVGTGITVAERFSAHYPVSAAGGELLDWHTEG